MTLFKAIVKTKYFIFGTLFSAVLLISSCIENPTPVGIEILPPEDFISVDTITVHAVDTESYDDLLSPGVTLSIFTGETDDIRSFGLIRFESSFVPQGLSPDTLAQLPIVKGVLVIKPVSYFGDSTGTVNINVHEIQSVWAAGNFNREIFDIMEFDPNISGTTDHSLSDSTEIEIEINRDLIMKWAQMWDNEIVPQGFLLSPGKNSDGIIGLNTRVAPDSARFHVIYGDKMSQDTVSFIANTPAFVGIPKKDIHVDHALSIRGGIPSRGIVRFDLSDLPHGALIHSATLELKQSPQHSDPSKFATDTLFVHQVIDPYKKKFNMEVPFSLNKGIDNDSLTYRANIGGIVQNWITVDDNYGFLVRYQNERSGYHQIGFHSEEARTEALKPKLMIIYSKLY